MGFDVTVVIPAWRAADTLARAVASAWAQSHPPVEVVVVDDASGAEHAAAMRDAVAGLAVRHLVMPRNGGPGLARNEGVRAARTGWVAFLDADDEWHPDKLATPARASERVDVLGSRAVWRGGALRPAADDTHPTTLAHALVRNPWHTSSVAVRRELAACFGPRRHAEDHEAWLRLLAGGARAVTHDVELVRSHKAPFGDGGLSGQALAMARAELAMFPRLAREGVLTPAQAARGEAVLCARLARRGVLLASERRRR